MAEWNPTTSYAPGANVSYLGLNYVRSIYPISATSGTNPREEMGTDPKGDAIRTWLLTMPSPSASSQPYHIGYFSIKQPERSDGTYTKTPPLTSYPGKLYPEHPYAGASNNQENAYGPIGDPPDVYLGTSVEMDQARSATVTPPLPSAPVMPANKCGVAMQNIQEVTGTRNTESAWAGVGLAVYQNLVFDSIEDRWKQTFPATGRKFYVFLFFNHPLYFRRQIILSIRISTYNYTGGYTIPSIPPVDVPGTDEGVYSTTTETVTGTDNNYWSNVGSLADFIKPANSVFEYALPDNVTTPGPYGSIDGTIYELVELFVSDVQSND